MMAVLKTTAGFASDVFHQRLLIVHGKRNASVCHEGIHFNRRVGRERLSGGAGSQDGGVNGGG